MKTITNIKTAIIDEMNEYKRVLRSIPSAVVAFFVVSVILMNLLANKEINTGISWLALDCGITVSWLSFLAMDMITKGFGAKASIRVSTFAVGVNLLVCSVLFIVSKIPGNWAAFYDYGTENINQSLNATFGGTWYILLGSTVAFLASAIVNSTINAGIGRLIKKSNFGTYAIRSYVSTLIGQFVDNFVFALIVSHTFFGWTMIQCLTCAFTGCIVELLCEVVFSPIGYRVSKNWENEGINADYVVNLSVNIEEV